MKEPSQLELHSWSTLLFDYLNLNYLWTIHINIENSFSKTTRIKRPGNKNRKVIKCIHAESPVISRHVNGRRRIPCDDEDIDNDESKFADDKSVKRPGNENRKVLKRTVYKLILLYLVVVDMVDVVFNITMMKILIMMRG